MSDTLTGKEGRENLWTDANSFDWRLLFQEFWIRISNLRSGDSYSDLPEGVRAFSTKGAHEHF